MTDAGRSMPPTPPIEAPQIADIRRQDASHQETRLGALVQVPAANSLATLVASSNEESNVLAD